MPTLPFTRDSSGVPQVTGGNEMELFFGQGFAHATDRALQLLLMRIAGQGRICELLDDSEASLRVDKFFRRANWANNTNATLAKLDAGERTLLDAYCRGVNEALSRRVPWEFKLVGYRPEPWGPQDVVLIVRMMGYVTLAASQGEMERLFIEMVQAGVPEERLHELFPGILGGLDIELLKRVKLGERLVPAELWGQALPRMMASNNWVIAGSRTASGKPILANDVHLEANRLPAVWCEMSLRCGERCLMGGTIPGLPGVLSGRNNDLAWGVTYAFMDSEDSWVEHCRDGKFHREDGDRWIEFRRRTEVIIRKNNPPVTQTYFASDHGVLDGDPCVEGYYLATRWTPADAGEGALKAALGLLNASSVEQGMALVGPVESAWNFVFADRQGNIGCQMTGLSPKRRAGVSGFVPLPGWKRENDWQGFVSPEDLPRLFNPPEGFIATANEDRNRFGRCRPITMPMGPYRAERIGELLAARANFAVADMRAMQFDVHSRQAESFMAILRPLLPATPQGDCLRHWNLRYDTDLEAPYLFEQFYAQLHREVFGKGGLGERAVEALRTQTGAFIDFYHNFDRVLLAENPAWFGGRSRADIYRQAALTALNTTPKKWGEVNRFEMTNIFFNGKLPRWLGFDRGPYAVRGGRATIHQAQLYNSGGRCTSFLPSFRLITDMSTHEIHCTVAGGPSDRRFSRWYASDVENWFQGRYKRIVGNTGG